MAQLESGWYAIHVRPKCERFVANLLAAKQYETFLPLYKERRRWSDRIKAVELPLIPNYVFCGLTGDTIGRVVTTPGVIRIVGAGRTPIAIEAAEMTALQRVDTLRLSAEPWPFLHVGELVELTDGPLSGVRGVLLRIKNEHRLIVSVSLLQRSIAVELDAASVISLAGRMVA
jgi:transcription antitermination factor NusG